MCNICYPWVIEIRKKFVASWCYHFLNSFLFLRFILILPLRLFPGLPSDLFLSGFPIKCL